MNYPVIFLSNGPDCIHLLWLLTPTALEYAVILETRGLKRVPMLIAAVMGDCLPTNLAISQPFHPSSIQEIVVEHHLFVFDHS